LLCTTIIPTINRATLARSVKSALAQGLDPAQHEILVFNNSDRPLPEADWLAPSRVTVIDSHSDLVDASNRGVALAAGKYVNFLHDDDYLLPNALKTLLDVAERSSCDWVYGAYNLLDDDGGLISLIQPQIKGNVLVLLVSGECLHYASSLIARDAFLRVGGLDPNIPIRSDLDLQCRVALFSDFDGTTEVVAGVRKSGGKESTFDWSRISKDHRKLREKALDGPQAFSRMQDSVHACVVLRGRACRTYLFSGVLNALDGRFSVAAGRFLGALRLAGPGPIKPRFWRGLFLRSDWPTAKAPQAKN
jgi:hypothetical protein